MASKLIKKVVSTIISGLLIVNLAGGVLALEPEVNVQPDFTISKQSLQEVEDKALEKL